MLGPGRNHKRGFRLAGSDSGLAAVPQSFHFEEIQQAVRLGRVHSSEWRVH